MRNVTRHAATLATLAAMASLLGGCAATTASEGSRAELYSDLTALAADSSALVEVVVESQEFVQDELPFTLSTVAVVASFAPDGLAADNGEAATIAPEAELVIRQLGPIDQTSERMSLLEVGERYLLFLTHSGLEGDAASQYYVTGVTAGIYAPERDDSADGDAAFIRVDTGSGDTLPARLTTAELTG
jgi:hypothetical protein